MKTQTSQATSKRTRTKPLRNPDLPNGETTPNGLFYLYHWLGQIAEREALWEFTRASTFSGRPENFQFAMYISINRYTNSIHDSIEKVKLGGYLPYAHIDTTLVPA